MSYTQRSDDDLFSSSIPNLRSSTLVNDDDEDHEDSSFSASQAIYEGAGVLGVNNAQNISQLTVAWINERNAPELLPYERTLVEPLIEAIENQAEFIMENVEDKFMSMLYQTEIERIKYLIKSYLRTRLFKIEKFTLYILRQSNLKQLLSSQEIVYARRYQELIESHNHDSFLHQLPRVQHRQDEKAGDLNMVVEPNMDAPVFCKVLETIGHVQIGQDEALFEKDGNFFLHYRDIKPLLKEGKVRLV